MPDYTTEPRTFVGEPQLGVFDGYAGFRLGREYQLRYERREDGKVAIALDYPHCAPGLEKVVSEAEFARWWKKTV